ncbi:MAG: WYL domain-containing protein [[Actinobacillus] rossii]|nr:WYL domain-containing protein [[Actinobacillus] rossii]MDD7569288.1 WYL domain-containing protein [[Actinobacillus] rossii]MDY4505189.1 WYL domain-containing protein [[Actinobacillus] rossii]MDY5792611.1 WYL domain-containing protein [[Actinobacillus] rossii]
MTTHKDGLETARLIIQILNYIPKNRKITVSELFELLKDNGFERDKRTIQRTLKSICDNFDVECDDRSRPYGFRWKEQSKGLSLPLLTEQQSLVLMLAERQLGNLLPSNIMDSMKPFFEQAKSQLIYDNKGKLANQWLDKVDVVPMNLPQLPAPIDTQIFNQVSIALYRNHYLNIEYRNTVNKIHKAQVMPLALVHQEGRTYLLVRYPEFGDEIKHLALHRFLSAEISTMTFERPRDFNLKKYKNEGHFYYGKGQKVKLTFCIEKWHGFYLLETPLSEDQVVLEETEDYYKFQVTVIDSMLLDWWIAKFGEEIWDVEKQII